MNTSKIIHNNRINPVLSWIRQKFKVKTYTDQVNNGHKFGEAQQSTHSFFINFYWSTVDLQCCVSFRYTESESIIHIHISKELSLWHFFYLSSSLKAKMWSSIEKLVLQTNIFLKRKLYILFHYTCIWSLIWELSNMRLT